MCLQFIAFINELRRKNEPSMEQTTADEMSDDNFYTIEMPVDTTSLEEHIDEIVPGKFVSFRHTGEVAGHGPPLNPKVSAYQVL